MDYYFIVEKHLELCREQIASLKQQLGQFPEGTLHVWKNGNYFTWEVAMPDGRRIYVPKSKREYASSLVAKKACQAQLHDLLIEEEACMRYLRYMKKSCREFPEFLASGPAYRDLLPQQAKNDEQRIEEWMRAPFRKYDKYPEGRSVPTLSGGYVRSKSEAIIAGQMDIMGIPYRYEEVHKIGGVDIACDFTALCVKNWSEIIIEHFGMMDDPEYVRSFNRKIRLYTENGYIPDLNLLIFFETSDVPLDVRMVARKLELVFF